jgi:hypothetical protein
MKMDCEGCADEFITSLNDNVIKCLSDIVLEHHNNLKHPTNKLLSAGFKVRRKKEILFGNKLEAVQCYL